LCWCDYMFNFILNMWLIMAWSLLVCLSFLGIFIESMLWSVTLGIGDLFYFRLVFFRILLNSVLMWNKKYEYFFDILKIIPLRRLIFKWSIFLIEEDAWHPCMIYYYLYFILENTFWGFRVLQDVPLHCPLWPWCCM